METNVLFVDPNNVQCYENELKSAAEVIKIGGLVAFPTETVYGLGGDGTNPDAAKKIYFAKGRPSDNPLIIHIAHPCDAEKYTYTSELFYKLADRFMPGALTVVLPAKESVPEATRGGLDTVAVRCPSHPIAHRLIELSGCAIAAPSANLSGSPSPTASKHVIDDMSGRIEMIIDGGDSEIGLESTIVKIEEDGTLTLLRPGGITVDELACVAPVSIASAVTSKLEEGAVALSPGMKYRHYAPGAPLVLLDGEIDDYVEYIRNDGYVNIGVLCYTQDAKLISDSIPDAHILALGAKDDIRAQAHHLFAILREADKLCLDKIYAPMPSTDGVGLALYNRMIRAAAHTIIRLRGEKDG